MADVSVKLTDTLSVDGVEPAGRTSSRCARDDIVSIQCARVTASWTTCSSSSRSKLP